MENSKVKEPYDEIFKVVVVGDANVGKTSLIQRFAEDTFTLQQKPTLALDYKSRVVRAKNKSVKL